MLLTIYILCICKDTFFSLVKCVDHHIDLYCMRMLILLHYLFIFLVIFLCPLLLSCFMFVQVCLLYHDNFYLFDGGCLSKGE